CMQALGFPLTF
nr:immunoglobulin light chain junction region [Macaca mulatta]